MSRIGRPSSSTTRPLMTPVGRCCCAPTTGAKHNNMSITAETQSNLSSAPLRLKLATDINLRLDLIVSQRSLEKASCDLPQCFAVISQDHRVGHASEHRHLPIAIWE